MDPLAVMVDLGWPWWVTSLIALSVTAVCAGVFATSRAVAIRAVVATLAVQGVVLAIVAPFVMKDDSPSSPAMHATKPGMASSLTRVEFARRADANCEAMNRFNSTFTTWPKATELVATARVLDRWIPVFNKTLGDQARLRPPAGERSIATAWMNSMAAIGHANETARDSAKAGDAGGVRAGYKASDAAAARSTTLSKQLGLKVCFS